MTADGTEPDDGDGATTPDGGRVRRLDDETVDRIAAGEVVTRPESVVKELVENALDAGATTVEIEATAGGIEGIVVRDDGHGMVPADARRAFERHATSKISDAEDVDAVETLGFRGEALPAIADAARVECTTKAGGHRGVRVTADDGIGTRPAGRGVGTTVTVRDLFADRPARRKSLASPRTEFTRISDLVTGYALLRPGVRFRLVHDDNEVFATPGTGSCRDALLAVYDRSLAGQSTLLDATRDGVRVTGVVVHPSVTRSKPSHVYTGVRGRAVDTGAVRSAVVDGYGTTLPSGRYPVAVVDVTVDPTTVDVNVHPAKRSVAFADPDRVATAVETAVGDAIGSADLTRTAESAIDLADSFDTPDGTTFEDTTVIGQFRDLYLLCERDDDLLVIDAHAAPPATVSVDPTTGAAATDHAATLAAAGYEFDRVGDTALRIRAVPAPFGRAATPESIRDVVDALRDGDHDDPREALLADLACHPSIRAGDDLSDDAAHTLLDRLGACDQPYACPHGRPTVLSVDEATLARGFDRQNTRVSE
ncbi:DNA mismatch repair protein MutL [Halobacteriales archaeon SW_7_68_16]|nr:MAG: DNA mismatch repair protein MutL [Halobacteriales archaeon SW_7_68_16]